MKDDCEHRFAAVTVSEIKKGYRAAVFCTKCWKQMGPYCYRDKMTDWFECSFYRKYIDQKKTKFGTITARIE